MRMKKSDLKGLLQSNFSLSMARFIYKSIKVDLDKFKKNQKLNSQASLSKNNKFVN